MGKVLNEEEILLTDPNSFDRLQRLTTPHLADACMRIGLITRCAPAEIKPIADNISCAGRVLPTRHNGSVDVFLEALEQSKPGDILIADNGGRSDEACIGDLIALEAAAAGCHGIVIDGFHRDTVEIVELGIPVFSRGAYPAGPQRVDQRGSGDLLTAQCGLWQVSQDDFAIGDQDGVIFVAESSLLEVLDVAETIRDTEQMQAQKMREGCSFRQQSRFQEYLKLRQSNASLGFRQYLRSIGGAIEE